MKKKKLPAPAKKKVAAKQNAKAATLLKKKTSTSTSKIKLTKQAEEALLKAYYDFWESNLSADMKKFSSYLVDDFSIFGSANGEVFFSKRDTVKFYTATAEELRGKAQLRNRKISIQPLDSDSAVVREESDLYILIGKNWSFYGHARISCIVKYIDGGWKAVHQHASFPDHRTEEGQQLASEKIEKENLELRDAVKRRTVELEHKNRELEIEAALERVRAKSMGMQKSEDLREVVKALYVQLKELGFQNGVAAINIMDPDSGDIDSWGEGFDDGYDLPEKYHVPYFDHQRHREIIMHWKSGTPYAEVEVSGEEKESYDNYFFFHTDFLRVPEATKQFMMQQEVVLFSMAYMQYGALTWTPSPISEEQSKILQRFAKVFEQTYTRFLDLQKAEAQTREAQIETALERVRSQTMAMHNSEDVGKCVVKMFSELTALGVDEGTRFGIGILNHNNENNQLWTANKVGEEVKMHIGNLDMTSHPLLKSARKAWIEQIPLHKYVLEGEDLLNYYRMLNNAPDYKIRIPIEKLPQREFHYGFIFEQGFFYVFCPSEFQPDLIRITQRFSLQFAQTYRRYLDLVKAEAQAREAQIEAALERVRSRSLAMHKSDELKDVIIVVFEKLKELDFTFDVAGIQLYTEGTKDIVQWVAALDLISIPVLARLPYSEKDFLESEIIQDIWTAKETGKNFHNRNYSFEEKNKFFEYAGKNNDTTAMPDDVRKFQMQAPGYTQTLVAEKHSALWVDSYRGQTVSVDEFNILGRFGRVFEQAYVRFLDLQKAEAQAREAQIQLALERVRAKTMAMHHSNELADVALTLYEEIQKLDFNSSVVTVVIMDKETGDIDHWVAGFSKIKYPECYRIAFFDHPCHKAQLEAWKSGEKVLVYHLSGNERISYTDYLFSHTPYKNFAEDEKEFMRSTDPVFTLSYMKHGALMLAHKEATKEQLDVLQRFAKVFEQTYTRFLDLQKAEAQAREAQIEAALEKVRSRSLAMHKSQDLQEVAKAVFERLKELGIKMDNVNIILFKDGSRDFDLWIASNTQTYSSKVHIPYSEHVIIRESFDAKESGKDFFVRQYSFDEKNEWFSYAFEHSDFRHTPIDRKKFILESEALTISNAYQKHTGIQLSRYSRTIFSDNENNIVKRFSKVFEQAYIRFLDLQKAEAQAREAQIEAALERIRSSAMAMHSSDGILEVTHVLREQIVLLGEKDIESILVHIYLEDTDQFEAWYSYRHPEFPEEQIVNGRQVLSWSRTARAKMDKEKYYENETEYTIVADHEMLTEWYNYLFTVIPEVVKLDNDGRILVPEVLYYNYSKISGGALLLITNSEASDHSKYLLRRASGVFGLAYSRFLDLQKAEAQAREAQIETALERVRSKTMAMHNSQDVGMSVAALFNELEILGILDAQDRCGIGIMQTDEIMEVWTAAKTLEGKDELTIGTLDMKVHPLLQQAYLGWQTKMEINQYILEGDDKTRYYQAIRDQQNYTLKRDYFSDYTKVIHTDFYFKEGCLYVFSQKEFPTGSSAIIIRFANLFGQTYRRYLDLQKAEAQAKEAVKRACVDRVRAEIASMRSTADLERITPLIWRELTTLGIPFIRCGVFIMDEKQDRVHSYLSTPEGNAIAAYHTPMSDPGGLAGAVLGWRQQQAYQAYWSEADFQKQADILVQHGAIQSREAYLKTIQEKDFHLHFVPFAQGMIYVGNTIPLQPDDVQLLQALADAFSVAYARYEDFAKLESAKQQIEKTLTDLKQTQAQLIQSEKMASLGELTAGIAHEIQNPLNFVNNFSEVNTELIDELKKELAVGNRQSADELVNDIKSNSEKINHHGKRAGDIVKGMLQHSRSSSGVKEPTDINALADEYLRLAYHGLRAKDKSFNATMKTEFDETIGNINIIPQDIGRVILNLITNAFYAVSEKSKVESSKLDSRYEPTVTVSTHRSLSSGEGRGEVIIKVKDNGNGIPDSIKEKIFQPFFTTKPTGQGTGLGLSLSYDIVKAHGGEIGVESREGLGSTFTIPLPIS